MTNLPLEGRAGRTAEKPRPGIAGIFVSVDEALRILRTLRPEAGPALRAMVDTIARHPRRIHRLAELAAIACQLYKAAKAKCRQHLDRHQRERHGRPFGAEGAPAWGVIALPDRRDAQNYDTERRLGVELFEYVLACVPREVAATEVAS
jgi:hypothetical protein